MTSLDPKKLERLREQLRLAYDPSFRRHHELMAFRVRTILLVSNAYESFSIERDASLEYAIYDTSQALHLRIIPQITTAMSGREALRILAEQRFDLVLASANLPDMDIGELAAEAERLAPEVPFVMLVFDGRWFDLTYGGTAPDEVDWIFAWRGSASVILSIIKLVEDAANVDRDIQLASVGTILVIEDSVERYSAMLPPLYTTLLMRTLALTPEGINESERMVRSRVRPKVLLARTFSEAAALVDKYQASLLGIISDLRTFHDDRVDPQSGPRFLRAVASRFPGIPILVHSAEREGAEVAASIGAHFLDKTSSRMAASLEQFVLEDVGFGTFVFRDAEGRVHGSASGLAEMEEALGRIPEASLLYHAERNQLSHWFRARGEVTLAALVAPLRPGDFGSTAELREFLRSAVAIARFEKSRGVVADFDRDSFDPDHAFLSVGSGSFGGKGRGLAFLFHLLSREIKDDQFDGVRVRIPRTLVVCTSEFDSFVRDNGFDASELEAASDDDIRRRFCEARFPAELRASLRAYLERVSVPLAVRSSSLLEDSHHQPCAGLYATYFLPNGAGDLEARVDRLCRAVALVYASVFVAQARQYHRTMAVNTAEEKMAVVIQEVVGRRHGDLFYPSLSGVAQSHNYYPVLDMRPEDGAVTIALGLGKHVVEGGEALRFCPRYPRVLPELSSPAAMLRSSQSWFFALDLAGGEGPVAGGPETTLVRLPLSRAEHDGELQAIGSVVSPDDDRVYEGLSRPGPRVVTFSRLLRSADSPLCAALAHLLAVGRQNLGCALEMEIAANLGDDDIELSILQIRPFVSQLESARPVVEPFEPEKVLCRCKRAMGYGRAEGVRDIVYVHPERFDRATSRDVAKLVGELNAKLLAERRRYVLIGPGRWGTLDPWLGIPAVWYQLSAAKVIIEVPARDIAVEPSQGTHFFHNMVSSGVGYLSLTGSSEGEVVRWDLLDAMPGDDLSPSLRHVSLPAPLRIRLDGARQEGVIALP